ncbi:MAG TPA: rhomboid family intramembrane serine protease [Verrucomicrobiae bacterium]|jgi:membrane associated rhomboid family serine protease|nr:rhomboid family intramembrane serine protease [Verrucomicrobiae bacterium]
MITRLLIALNVLAFGFEFVKIGPNIFGGSVVAQSFYDIGALVPVAITQNHEYWRLISTGFLHASLIHIAVNMFSLWILGRVIENIAGSVRMAVIYFVSLVVSSLACVYFQPQDTVSLGASGAIFGLFGAFFAIGFKHGKPGMDMIKANLGILVINLIFTFTFPGISKAAHVGGLIAGFLLTYAIYFPPRPVAARVVDANTGAVLESEFESAHDRPPHA